VLSEEGAVSNTRTESVLLFGHIVFHALQATVLALVVLLVMFFWPAAVPFAFFQFWRFSGNLPHVLLQCWPLFAWGVGVTSIIAFFHTNDWEENHEAEGMFLLRAAQSLSAGFFEEVCYRWLLFLALIPFFKVANVALFGLPQWLFSHVTGPIADVLTLGHLHTYLYNGLGWAVGAALLSANNYFQKGHADFLQAINAWFVGMVMFYLMFTYGLLVSILIHFLYDLFIMFVIYVDAVIERKLIHQRRTQPHRFFR
jgi:hypothetical protein